MLAGASAGSPKTERHGRIEVAARDVTDGIGHGEDGQAECKRYAEKANADRGECC
jgi:hypothetical protein